jgi:tetratricopeptide (TPR) repeat protein
MVRLRVAAYQFRYSATGIATSILALIALFVPFLAHGQCQPIADSAKLAASKMPASGAQPEFFDEPQFTVAGVTDTTNLGGHGSNVVVRTKEALAKDVVSLGTAPVTGAPMTQASPQSPAQIPPQVEDKQGNPLQAVREYQRAAETNPTESNFFNWGAELLVHHAVEPAIEVFTKGNRLFPDSARMLVGLGVAWYARGSYEQAALHLCEASDLNPGDPNPYLFLGKIQSVETTRSAGLVERLQRFAKLQPENALANYYYALALWKQRKNLDDAQTAVQVESLLRKAVRLDPKLGLGYLQLGILSSDRKDFSQAISNYQKAIEASPRLEEAHYRLAQAYRRTGEQSKAQQELQLYNQLSKQTAEDVERERHEVQQFVYTLRSPASSSKPQ